MTSGFAEIQVVKRNSARLTGCFGQFRNVLLHLVSCVRPALIGYGRFGSSRGLSRTGQRQFGQQSRSPADVHPAVETLDTQAPLWPDAKDRTPQAVEDELGAMARIGAQAT